MTSHDHFRIARRNLPSHPPSTHTPSLQPRPLSTLLPPPPPCPCSIPPSSLLLRSLWKPFYSLLVPIRSGYEITHQHCCWFFFLPKVADRSKEAHPAEVVLWCHRGCWSFHLPHPNNFSRSWSQSREKKKQCSGCFQSNVAHNFHAWLRK